MSKSHTDLLRRHCTMWENQNRNICSPWVSVLVVRETKCHLGILTEPLRSSLPLLPYSILYTYYTCWCKINTNVWIKMRRAKASKCGKLIYQRLSLHKGCGLKQDLSLSREESMRAYPSWPPQASSGENKTVNSSANSCMLVLKCQGYFNEIKIILRRKCAFRSLDLSSYSSLPFSLLRKIIKNMSYN